MTNPTPLSPAAQAVVNAIDEVRWDWGNMQEADATIIAAAALRTVAKRSIFADTAVGVTSEVVRVELLLTIADELEGPQ